MTDDPNEPRFEVLREHLREHGWLCGARAAVHPLLGRHGLTSALVLNGEAAAVLSMSEIGLVAGAIWDGEPRVATC